MNIIVFSLGVVFKNVVQGGSQRVLWDVAKGLGERGHTVTIYCPQREDNHEIFNITECVTVKPVLPLKGSFPQPYAVSPFHLTQTVRILEEALLEADLLYCHDGGLNLEMLKTQVPTVISLRDFCYPETLLGAINFHQCSIIVNSEHTYRCLMDSFVHVNSDIYGRVFKVFNGYAPEHYKPGYTSDSMQFRYGFPSPDGHINIGFPHRPQMEKGFDVALKVISKLKDKYPGIRMLIPSYMDRGLSQRTDDMYASIDKQIREDRLSNHVLFHPWISQADMPDYYSYCDVILCIGNFVEAFSNVAVESLLCQTPVIAADVATYRTMPIRQYLKLVPYGNVEKTTECLDNLIAEIQQKTTLNVRLAEARKYIIDNFSIERCVDNYERIFQQALTMPGTATESPKQSGRYRLSAWCSAGDGYIYDDYSHQYRPDPFHGLFDQADISYTMKQLLSHGISQEACNNAIAQGILSEELVCGE